MIGLAVLLKNEYPLINSFISENDIFTLFEQVVFVDDMSDDGSYEYIEQYLAGVGRNDLITRHSLNYNFSAQRNFAASLCNTDYICRIDFDEKINQQTKQFLLTFQGKKDYYTIFRDTFIDGEFKDTTKGPFIYKNNPSIYFIHEIHEILVGYKTEEQLPDDCRIIHHKTGAECVIHNKWYYDNFARHRQIVNR